MNMKKNTSWKWRNDEISYKEFTKLSRQEKEEYIILVEGLKPEQRSTSDEIILNLYSKKKLEQNKFLEL